MIRKRKEEQDLLKQVFESYLYNNSFYALMYLVENGTMLYSQALKSAFNQTHNRVQQIEFKNLYKLATLVNM